MPTKTAEQEAVNGTGPNKLAELRKPFDSKYIGKLPRVTCKLCSSQRDKCPKEDGEHKRRRCDGSGRQDKTACFAFVSPAHIHIDFVGHAHVTDRLLSVDSYWTWEPMSFTPEGSPAIGTSMNGKDAVMWIRLTVAGVTRPGVGSCPKGDDEVEKQLIGDALKNAAMRFGVALDLWAKSELESSAHAADQDQSAPPSSNDAEAQTADPEGWTLSDEQAWRKTYTERFKKLTDPKVKADAKADAQALGLVWSAPIPKAVADDVDELLAEYLTPPTTSPEADGKPGTALLCVGGCGHQPHDCRCEPTEF